MTRNERIELGNQIGMTGLFYGVEIEQNRLTMILNYWESTNIAPPTIIAAYKRFMEESKIYKFPPPAEIMSIIRPKVDSQDFGVLTAARILKAIKDFGWSNPESAKKYIGDAGWSCVRIFGGWEHICSELGVSIDMTTFQAQVREILKSEHKIAEVTGADHLRLSCPDGNKIENKKQSNDLISSNEILKKLLPKKGE